MRLIIAFLILSLVTGCSTSYEKISSGAIGCAPRDITVYGVDSSHEGTSWVAVCNNRVYYCFQADEDMGGKFSCAAGQTRSTATESRDDQPVTRREVYPTYPRDNSEDIGNALSILALFFIGLFHLFDR